MILFFIIGGNGNNPPSFLKHTKNPLQQIKCMHSSLALTWIWSRGHCKASPSFSLNKGILGAYRPLERDNPA